MKNKVIRGIGRVSVVLILFLSLSILLISFISSANRSVITFDKTEKSQAEIDCKRLGFCWGNERCYSMGARITVEPEDKKQDLAWRDEAYLYCGEKRFVPQKITGETCENDFECQSNKCFDRICQQKNGIKITEIYSDKETVIRNLILREKEMFYFSGLNKNYSIGFGRNESNFIFLINDETYILNNKIFNLDNYSQITVESILFENGLPRANITLIESINPFNDSEKLLEKINCNGLFINGTCRKEGESFEINNTEYKIENMSLVESPKEENSDLITGGVIETKKENFISIFLKRVKDFFDNLFRENKNG